MKRSYENRKDEIEETKGKRRKKIKRGRENNKERDNIIKDLITAMLVCNNVTPCYDNDKKELQSSRYFHKFFLLFKS